MDRGDVARNYADGNADPGSAEHTEYQSHATVAEPSFISQKAHDSTPHAEQEDVAPETQDTQDKQPEEADGTQEPVSKEKLKQWFELTADGIDGYKKSIKKIERMHDIATYNWSEEVGDLLISLRNNHDFCERMNSLMSDAIKALEPEGAEEADHDSEMTDPEFKPLMRFSIPRLNFLPWKELSDVSSLPPREHAAIDIPSTEPSTADLLRSDSETDQGLAATTTSKAEDVHTAPEKLPERIRITSLRLLRFLDYGLNNGELSCSRLGPLTILRPFKLLFCLDEKIRSRIVQFEQARRKIKDMDEEAYLEEFNKDPLPDEERGEFSESIMGLSELTGFINDCRCLTQFMDTILIPEKLRLEKGPEKVRFADLWFLFPQGSLIYCKDHNIPQKIWKVVQRTGGRRYISKPPTIPEREFRTTFTPFVLDCYHLDYDGTRYVQTYRQFKLTDFEGTQPTKALSILPLSVAERDLKLVDRHALIERGRQFMDLTKKAEHRQYSGRSHYLTPDGSKLSELEDKAAKGTSHHSERIDSEVIVDFTRALQEVPWWRPTGSEPSFYEMEVEERGDGDIDKDEKWDKVILDDFLESEARKFRRWETWGTGPQEEDDLLLLPDRVFAFVLRSRRWACLQIGKEINGNERLTIPEALKEPWNNLELPSGHKELVQSLITSHFSTDKAKGLQFDLVRDKGKGVIILLHGVPGVGKTSTAECAAESSGRPLLPITCGDLGLTPGEVETKLQEVFRLAQAWGCILLLDESDIFLAQRTVTDMGRNALVSVFLRTLEYYEGVLFLTTNRVGVFDEAFKSRIHMSLYYPPLERWQTIRIWQAHIRKAVGAGIQVNEPELMSFAEQTFDAQSKPESGPVWNGRQIRNAFQSAVALAGFHTTSGELIKLDTSYFRNVFDVSDKFSNYIWRTKQGHTDADFNRMFMTRRDDFVYVPVNFDAAKMAALPTQQLFPSANYPQSTFGISPQRPMNFMGMQGQQQQPSAYVTTNMAQPFNQAAGYSTQPSMQPQPAHFQPQQQMQSQAPTFQNQYSPQASQTMPQQSNQPIQAQYQSQPDFAAINQQQQQQQSPQPVGQQFSGMPIQPPVT
ncbi:ATPase [Lasiodiplodia theobromae]|nr:ATPase [Lasiodiplodia theobromae]